MIVGVFPSGAAAQLAIDDLYYADFTEQEVGMLTRDGDVAKAATSTTTQEASATTGAVAGAAVGGAVGTVAGLLLVNLIPGFGQVVTGGALMAVLIAALTGAAGGNVIGPFVAMGLTEDQAKEADRHFAAGRSMVFVRAPGREEKALEILRKRGAEELKVTPSRGGHLPG